MTKRNLYGICQLVGWTSYCVAGIVIGGLFQGASFLLALSTAVHCLIGFWFSHLYRGYIKRHNWAAWPLKRLVPAVVGASVVLAFGWMVLAGLASVGLWRGLPKVGFPPSVLVVVWFNWSSVLFIWSLIYFGVHFVENFRRAEIERWKFEAAVKEAELRALKSQMSPHFIFNCLNSLRALVVEDPKAAQDSITKLANMLRYSLQSSQKETVTLQEEIRMVTDYLALEAIRFEERLAVTIDLAPDSVTCQVPPMAIQTLVENAIKHGISKRKEGGGLIITSSCRENSVHIRVINDGQMEGTTGGTGLGLRNTRERLALLFGENASLHIANHDAQVMVEIIVPATSFEGMRDGNLGSSLTVREGTQIGAPTRK